MFMKKIKLVLMAALAIAAFAPATGFAQKAGKKEKKDIAVQLYSLRDVIGADFEGTIKEVGKMGYTAAEAAGYGDGKFYGLSPHDYKAALKAAGVRPLSSHTGRTPNEEELKTKNFANALSWWDQAILAHKEAGIDYIVIPGMYLPNNMESMMNLCEFLNEVGKRCKEAGIKFGFHNHSGEFHHKIDGQKAYDLLLENTNPDYFFLQMDVYWAVMAQESPVAYFKKYPGRFKLLHIKDRDVVGDSGMVGFDAIFNHAKEGGLEYPIVEMEGSEFGPVEGCKKSLEYLQKAPFVKKSYDPKKKR